MDVLLAVVGIALPAAVTFVGLMLKRAVDNRTLALAGRAAQDREAEQRRLQLEAAMRTVQLLSLADGQPASIAQSSSAVLVLQGLGENELALSLVRELWPKDQISSSAAVQVIDGALGLSHHTQRTAANTLLHNVGRLDGPGHQSEWPDRLEHWDVAMDEEARYAVALTLVAWLNQRPPSSGDWRLALFNEARQLEPGSAIAALTIPP